MRTIRIIEHISLDGVIQGPGRPEEDLGNEFAHGGWAVPRPDPAVKEAIAHPPSWPRFLRRSGTGA